MEIRLNNGKLVSEQEFRSLHPNISFPKIMAKHTLAEYGAAVVFESPQPPEGYTRAGAAQDANGKWVKVWKKEKKNA